MWDGDMRFGSVLVKRVGNDTKGGQDSKPGVEAPVASRLEGPRGSLQTLPDVL